LNDCFSLYHKNFIHVNLTYITFSSGIIFSILYKTQKKQNDNGISALTIAENDNMKLFKEAATGSASNSVLDQLDRSNAIVRVLLSLLTSTQMENFSHVHECFNAGLDFATWYEAEGK